MQQQPQQQSLNLVQRIQTARQLWKIMRRAFKQDSTALQVEDMLVHSFEELNISVHRSLKFWADGTNHLPAVECTF